MVKGENAGSQHFPISSPIVLYPIRKLNYYSFLPDLNFLYYIHRFWKSLTFVKWARVEASSAISSNLFHLFIDLFIQGIIKYSINQYNVETSFYFPSRFLQFLRLRVWIRFFKSKYIYMIYFGWILTVSWTAAKFLIFSRLGKSAFE